LVNHLVGILEIIIGLMILTLKFDVNTSLIGDEEISEQVIYLLHGNFLKGALKKRCNVLNAQGLWVNIVTLNIDPILCSFGSEVLSLHTEANLLRILDFLHLLSSKKFLL
jgi:hypothetical protein